MPQLFITVAPKHRFSLFPPHFRPQRLEKDQAFALTSASAFFAHPPHAHLPASHGHAPSAPPQLQAVLSDVPSTLCSCASAAEVVVVEASGFLAQLPQPHLPGSQGQEPVSPPQEQAVLSVLGMGWMFIVDIGGGGC